MYSEDLCILYSQLIILQIAILVVIIEKLLERDKGLTPNRTYRVNFFPKVANRRVMKGNPSLT